MVTGMIGTLNLCGTVRIEIMSTGSNFLELQEDIWPPFHVSFRIFYIQLLFNKRQGWRSSSGRACRGEGASGNPEILRASLHSLHKNEARCRAPEAVGVS